MKTPARFLSHRLLRGVLLVAGAASLVLGFLFLGFYREQLVQERAEISMQINRTLQAAWENAMLKRDVEGLRDIVAKLGGLNGIRDVLILSPAGEIRFASDPAKLGLTMTDVAGATSAGSPLTSVETHGSGGEVLRSINPVPNRAPCTPCHGTVAANPVNGVLIIDYDAAPIRESATRSAILLMLAVPSFSQWVRNNQIRSAAENLQNGLRLARTQAMTSNRQVVFSLTNAQPGLGIVAASGGLNWTMQSIPLIAGEAAEYIQGGNFGGSINGLTVTGPGAPPAPPTPPDP